MSDFFDECKAYVGFGPRAAATLAALEPVLAPHFAAICDRFYAAVATNPTASASRSHTAPGSAANASAATITQRLR